MNNKATVLVVDDEPGMRILLTFEFNHLGCMATTVQNTDEAMNLLKNQSFDIILTDIRMPGSMDGIDFIEAYRKEKPNQKVIFMTGYAEEEKLTKALQNPLNRCLKKPFMLQDLQKTLECCLEKTG